MTGASTRAKRAQDEKVLPRLAWSVREVAVQLGLAYDAALLAVHEGQISSIKIGRHYRIPDAELTRLVGEASRTSAQPAPIGAER